MLAVDAWTYTSQTLLRASHAILDLYYDIMNGILRGENL